ncbi:3'-5' exonuclease [Ceratobasidium sp. AG-Ba]|nr:3'-5' exonuclease [Ceratobasidium sp. AG-Ba]QRW15308.1 3'-5' exonuclease [Ceratobasidium sp. AG-Ba]
MEIFVRPLDTVFLIDITTLDQLAFNTAAAPQRSGTRRGPTLKYLLECPDVPKVFYDVRNDADNLLNAHDISLKGVIDLQLYELAVRVGSKRFFNPLSLSIMNDIRPSESAQKQWSDWINNGQKAISPDLGGDLRVWDERPLRPELINYCLADVVYLPRLLDVYEAKLASKPEWRKKIELECQSRLKLAEDFAYEANGKLMARAPADWR